MTKMPVIFTGHGSPMIALEKNDLTRTFHNLGKEIIDTFGRPSRRRKILVSGTLRKH